MTTPSIVLATECAVCRRARPAFQAGPLAAIRAALFGRTVTDTRRLEAFSDGVLAIIITIVVPELKVPRDASRAALWPLWPLLSPVLYLAGIATAFVTVASIWLVPDRRIEQAVTL